MLATLQLAADAPGFHADARLALPTADGGLAPLRECVVDDAPWLLRRMRPGAVRLVSAVGAQLQGQLGLRALSAAVREEVVREEAMREAQPQAGQEAGAGGAAQASAVEPARAEALTARLHSLELAAAAAALLAAEAGARDASLRAPPRGLRAEAVTAALAPLRVRLVPQLRTRLLLLPAGDDVTADGKAEGAAWFLDGTTSTILLLARPPAGLSHEICLHQVT